MKQQQRSERTPDAVQGRPEADVTHEVWLEWDGVEQQLAKHKQSIGAMLQAASRK